jgi:hypothetical protein
VPAAIAERIEAGLGSDRSNCARSASPDSRASKPVRQRAPALHCRQYVGYGNDSYILGPYPAPASSRRLSLLEFDTRGTGRRLQRGGY